MLGWKWIRGEARLKTLAKLPQEPLQIPQPGRQDAPISLNPVDKPEKKLRVYVCTTGDFTYHVSQIKQTGMEYASCLQACKPPPRDAWMGTRYQLYPKMIYGAVSFTHDPEKLENAFQLVWYNLLPTLQVNRHIRKEFRTLPLCFQGLALPNPNIDVLSSKIHLIQEHWERPGSMIGKMLESAYLVFQTEVGVRGNVLTRSYKALGCLATHGFFKNLWQLLLRYGVTFHLPSTTAISLLREDDQPLMDAIHDNRIFTTKEIVEINKFCHWKKVLNWRPGLVRRANN
jgi:hypothetical protein